MKNKIANYSLVILAITFCFGLFQAKNKNMNPFKNSYYSNPLIFDNTLFDSHSKIYKIHNLDYLMQDINSNKPDIKRTNLLSFLY